VGTADSSRQGAQGLGRREPGGAHGRVDPGHNAHGDRHGQAAPGGLGRDDHRLTGTDGTVTARSQPAGGLEVTVLLPGGQAEAPGGTTEVATAGQA